MLLVGPSAAAFNAELQSYFIILDLRQRRWLLVVAAVSEWSQSGFEWNLPTSVLILDCFLAFGLNITIMYMLRSFSAFTYALCGYTKDVLRPASRERIA